MKGVILAGGKATRLRPLTWVTNKHLLPVYHQPMIYFPLQSLRQAGIQDVLIVTNGDVIGQFFNLCQNGKRFGLNISYEIQPTVGGGLSDALKSSKDFVHGEPSMVILGDNIFDHDLGPAVKKFKEDPVGAMIFAKPMEDCRQYGVVEMEGGKVISIEEKPENPKSNLVQLGIYIYDKNVFDHVDNLKPSKRGELEITDLNNIYLHHGTLKCEVFDDWWIDAGTSYDELLRANMMVADFTAKGKIKTLETPS
jgi:glucose-1-phosphate thymidylyltransferase